MKILQVTNFFKPSWEAGGPARVSYELSKKLMEIGHDVTVYTTDGFKWRLNVGKNKPVDVDGLRTYYFRNLSSHLARKMVLPTPYYLPIVARREIKDFDVIHIHEYRTMPGLIVYYYATKYSVSYVLKAGGSLPIINRMQRMKKTFDILFGYRMLQNASKAIARNKREVKQYKKMGVNETKIEIIPVGINLNEYDNLPKKGVFRKKYSINDHEKIILFLGRIHKIKGIDLLVKAFRDLLMMLENIRLVIVGPDDGFMSTLKKLVIGFKIGNRILFTGPLYEKDKLKAYVDADVFVLPSIYETFPSTVLEAWACGVPVIVTDRCGIADFVAKVGYVVEYDKDQLQDALFKILSNEELRKKLGAESKKFVRENFSWDKIVKKTEALYETILTK